MSAGDEQRRATALVTGKLALVVVAMFGFGYLMVPLYDVLCEITGLNGKTGTIASAEAAELVVDPSREVQVSFASTVTTSGPWAFEGPPQAMTVHPGQAYTVNYAATNLAERAVVGQAVPSVAPRQAAKYFNKTECFCFDQQRFAAKERKEMPVTFVVDPKLPRSVDSIVLSYTFFDAGAFAGD